MTEKYDVKNRYTGEVQFTAEIECTSDALPSVKLGLAVRWGFKAGANLAGAYLAGAYLDGAYLARANLAGANLAGADLAGADLAGAYLTRANLARANLTGATLPEGKITRPIARVTRTDGHEFFLWGLENGEHIIKAGCQSRTISSYREHVAKDYPSRQNAAELIAETTAILDYLERRLADLTRAEEPK